MPELRLNDNEIHFWVSYPDKIQSKKLLLTYSDLMNNEERKRHARFCFERHRHDYLITRALLRTTLSHYAKTLPEDWEFSRNIYGKPKISSMPEAEKLSFSISHTDGMIVCAVTKEKNLGIDVEDSSRAADVIGIAERFFSQQEVQTLSDVPNNEKEDIFYDYWTLKESYIKACGMGLSIPLDDFSFKFTSQNKCHISFFSKKKENTNNWKFMILHLKCRYKIALAVWCNRIQNYDFSLIETIPLLNSHAFSCPVAKSSGSFFYKDFVFQSGSSYLHPSGEHSQSK